MAKVEICGIRFDNLTAEEAVKSVFRGDMQGVCTVTSPNALVAQACTKDPICRSRVNASSIVLPRGAGIRRAAKKKGTPLHATTGNFADCLVAESAKRGERVFLLGGAEGIAPIAGQYLESKHPGLTVCGAYWGGFSYVGEENERLLWVLNATKPDVLLIGMPTVWETGWIDENLHRVPSVRIACGIGGELDVWAGRIKPVPREISLRGMEWAYRMIREPSHLQALPNLLRFDRTCRLECKSYRKMHTEPTKEPSCRNQMLQK